MSLSHETQQKVNQFAKQQSRHYLDAAEMTYLEQLRKNTGNVKSDIAKQLAKFKANSQKSQEAQSDLAVYMTDYINDLMSQGLSEQDAFAQAKVALSSTDTEQYDDMQERFRQYYANMDPAEQEVVGLYYAGLTLIGMVVGAFIGFLVGGGKSEFLSEGWIDTLIGGGVGLMIGVGAALICNAVIVSHNRK